MDGETIAAVAFLIFSMFCFFWGMNDIRRGNYEYHDRKLNNAREFGFENSRNRKRGIIHRPHK